MGRWGCPGGPWASIGGSLGVAGGSPEGPMDSSGRARDAAKTQKVFSGCLGGVRGLPWADFGRRGWGLGLTWELELSVFHLGLQVFCRPVSFVSLLLFHVYMRCTV